MRRRLAWRGEQVGWFLGIVAWLLLMVLQVPLVPLFALLDDLREARDAGRGRL